MTLTTTTSQNAPNDNDESEQTKRTRRKKRNHQNRSVAFSQCVQSFDVQLPALLHFSLYFRWFNSNPKCTCTKHNVHWFYLLAIDVCRCSGCSRCCRLCRGLFGKISIAENARTSSSSERGHSNMQPIVLSLHVAGILCAFACMCDYELNLARRMLFIITSFQVISLQRGNSLRTAETFAKLMPSQNRSVFGSDIVQHNGTHLQKNVLQI